MSNEFSREPSGLERELLERFGFELEDKVIKKILTRDEIIYLTGGWFEEYAFNEINKMSTSLINDVKMGIQVRSISGTDNELDIAFMKDNTFYHIECKTLGEEEEQFIIRDEVYKKGAILHQLGKGGNAFICTTHNLIRPALLSRARDYNVVILNLNEAKNLLEEIFKRIK
ncbi:MAG: Card1-like endonuclease domain-containing protein [Nitrospirota bacterium]